MSQQRSFLSPGPLGWAFTGLALGAVAAWLVARGNPGNMGLCVACFVRDGAGTLGGAALGMGGVAYLRPEIPGLVLGALAAALATGEFRARGGSAFLTRFALGFAFMAGALVFLGCTVRAWLRLGGGDLNALAGVGGLVAGIGAGALFLRTGYDLGRARALPAAAGWIGPAAAVAVLALGGAVALGARPAFLTVTPAGARATAQGAVLAGGEVLKPAGARLEGGAVVAADGAVVSPPEAVSAAKPLPGGKRAPFLLSLLAGLALGALAQRTRLCTTGGIRDALLHRAWWKLAGPGAIVLGALAVNAALGQVRVGFDGQPVAHADLLGNVAGMAVAGFAAALMGGCPLRQVIMTGEGDLDAGGAVLGMVAAALVMHGTGAAASPKGVPPLAWPALGVAAALVLAVATWRRQRAVRAARAQVEVGPAV